MNFAEMRKLQEERKQLQASTFRLIENYVEKDIIKIKKLLSNLNTTKIYIRGSKFS